MYTKRELPLLIGRSKPVISSTAPFAKVFGGQIASPTERTFTLSGKGMRIGGFAIGAILLLMFLGRR